MRQQAAGKAHSGGKPTMGWGARRALGALVALGCLTTVTAPLAGCKKAKEERKLTEAAEAAQLAIAAYSKASDDTNAAHKAVLQAFAAANRSGSLSAYKAALRGDVLPKLDVFLAQLKAMPTGTPELAAIHKPLVEAYQKARVDLDAFEAGLTDPSKLGQFDTIRSALQTAVQRYHLDLAKYYEANARQLRLAREEAAEASGVATPTDAPAAGAKAATSTGLSDGVSETGQ